MNALPHMRMHGWMVDACMYVEGSWDNTQLYQETSPLAAWTPSMSHAPTPVIRPKMRRRPAGRQAGLPAGRQAGVPAGRQAGVPAGRQAGVPAGTMVSTRGGSDSLLLW
eukprot:GHVU01058079.1.p2 GENE.GHVU01058079.1~~GHVU01058079.1.p2  ORF type:complete len:109 (-),score=8.78 GHVU01058079.1:269-595(-)